MHAGERSVSSAGVAYLTKLSERVSQIGTETS